MKILRRQNGFSLLETLVASSLVAVVMYYVVNGVTNTLSTSVNLNDRMIANQIVQERISKMKNLSGFYVPVVNASDQEGFYVGCFSKRGVAVKDDTGANGESVVFAKAPGTPSGKCNQAQVEVQFAPSASQPGALSTFIIVNQAGKKNFTVHKRTLKLEKLF